MVRRGIKFLSLAVTIVFFWQSIGWAQPDVLRPKARAEKSVTYAKGTGENLVVAGNSSTQAVSFVLTDGKTGEILLHHEETFSDPYYARFKCPRGYREDLLAADPDHLTYRSDPVMMALAFFRGNYMMRKKAEAAGWNMANVKAIDWAGQQHGIVLLNNKAVEILRYLHLNINPNDDIEIQLAAIEVQIRAMLADPTATIWMNKSKGAQKGAERITRLYGSPQATKEAGGSVAELRFSGAAIMERYYEYQATDPSKWDEVATILDIAAFMQALCTGDARTPWGQTDGSGTNLMRLDTKDWDPRINLLTPGAKQPLTAKLTRIAAPTEVVGTASPLLTQLLGVNSKTVVAPSGGDNPNGDIGQGTALEPTTLSMSLGSSDVLTLAGIPEKKLNAALKRLTAISSNVFVEPTGKYMEIACVQNGSLALESIRDKYITDAEAGAIFEKRHDGRKPDMNVKEDKDEISAIKWGIFEELISDPSCPPGNNGAMMIPMNTQEEVVKIFYDPDNPFTYNLTDLSHANRAQVLRAAVECRIYFLKWLANEMGVKVKKINLTGGAASKIIQRLVANIFNADVCMLKETDPVATGGAAIAWKTYWDSTHKRPLSWKNAIGPMAAIDGTKTVKPDGNLVKIYQRHFPNYVNLVKRAIATAPAAKETDRHETDALMHI